ncbi:hypothetical protein H6768_04730 [Candidatus Peribacteria bacterium]|nr:hypothetical protein [Candidatus Peribacteria bacterium]
MRSILRQIVAVLALVGIATTMVPSTFAVTYTAQAAADKLAASGFIVDQSATPAAYRLADNLLRQEAVGTAANVLGILNVPLNEYVCQNKFSDVTAASGWVCRAAELAAAAGLTNAANATFRPRDNLTRYEALVFALRAAGLVPAGSWSQSDLIQLGVDNGLITSAAGFNVNGSATRGEFFQYVVRGLDSAETPELCDILGICPTNPGTPNTSGSVSVSLSGGQPNTTLVAGQATAELAKITFSGNGTVTGVNLQRIGVSSDATLSNVYLFDGAVRLTDAASVTNGGVVTFNNPAGLFTVSGSKTITVKSDIASGTSGQTVGVKLTGFTVAGQAAASANISGNVQTIATATLASVSAGTVTPSNSTINPGPAQTLWQSTLTVTQRDVYLKRMAFRQVGSAPANSLQNFKLFVNGVQVGNVVPSMDVNSYVTFDLSGAAALLAAGSRIVRVEADVVSGASRTIQLSLRQAADIDLVDKDYGVNITPTSTPWVSAAAMTISGTSGGTLTIQKDTATASADITADATDVLIGKFTAQAFGEAIKIETLKAGFTSSDANIGSLRNGRVLVNGVQYGSTATLVKTGSGGTSYTLNYVVPAGQVATIEVRADIYDNDGTNNVSANDTIAGDIVTGTSNAVRQDSLGYLSVPGADVSGQTMTVKTASAVLLKNTSYADQTVNIPQTGYKLGSWNITAGTAEDLNVNTVAVDFTSVTNATFSAADLTNVQVKVGNSVSTVYSTVSATGNTFSIPTTVVPKGTSAAVEVWVNVLSGGITAADSIKATATVSGNSAVSGTAVTTSAVDGQTITYNTGTFTISVDGSSPVARSVSGNQEVTAGVFKFQASNDSYTIKEFDVSVATATVASSVTMVKVYDGATLIASIPFTGSDADSGSNNMASFTGLSWVVPSGQSKLLTVKLMLNNIGQGAGTSGVNAAVQLDRVRYQDSAGTVATSTTDYNANALLVYKAVPTLAQVAVDTTSKLVNGTSRDFYKITISAPASTVSANGIAIKQLRLPVTWNDGAYDGVAGGGNDDILEVESMKLILDGSDITSSDVTIQDQAGNSVESTSGLTYTEGAGDTYVIISWDAGKELAVGAGQTRTLTLRGTPQGFNVIDAATTPTDSVGFALNADSAAQTASHNYLNGGTAATADMWFLHDSAAATNAGGEAANFIWSDVSANPHLVAENASSSGDWTNGYKIYDDFGISQIGM